MVTTILWGCALVATLVFGVMIYSIASFRAERGIAPANYRPRSIVEVIWALIPLAIFIGAALPSVRLIGAGDISVVEASE